MSPRIETETSAPNREPPPSTRVTTACTSCSTRGRVETPRPRPRFTTVMYSVTRSSVPVPVPVPVLARTGDAVARPGSSRGSLISQLP
ncbi:hypothetical protein SAMN04487904_102363 [Actinopolyspora lacussalsi subsp. righensis]|uniref:Uncharacterized protein n=1 Tax=Actinopolyspora righensis TaxID=995060 RepID=A0A1I6YAV0_9ACTN|nr:hypothetical protein SAMN04487904_102363 [Actinopolyspora righensis]